MGGLSVWNWILAVFIAYSVMGSLAQEDDHRRQKRSLDKKETAREAEDIFGAGHTYIRWGRTTCADYSHTSLVYKGFAAGSYYTAAGGGANLLCISEDPVWGTYDDKLAGNVQLHGVEYHTGWPLENDNIATPSHPYQDVPCAVCMVAHRTTLMIPGRRTCFPGWQLEYHGYLMSGNSGHKRSEFICVDHAAEADPGGQAVKYGALLYYVEGVCGSLRCPPYVQGREITCVVCSR